MNQQEFHAWLRRNGAEVLAPTNSYEFARFNARGAVHIVYEGRRGISTNGFGIECLDAFQKRESIWMGTTQRQRGSFSKKRAALLERDGNTCIFCWEKILSEDDMTVEHLVSRQNGGPDHLDNLALAHGKCNQAAANMPLAQKIRWIRLGKF